MASGRLCGQSLAINLASLAVHGNAMQGMPLQSHERDAHSPRSVKIC